jgi:hypothetical protein
MEVMAMDKKHGPEKPSSKGVQATPGAAPTPDSGSPGAGSENAGVYVNQRGEVCYGTECFNLAIDEQRREIRVNIKQSGQCQLDPVIEAMRQVLGEGARTVYEVESEFKGDKPK